MKFLFLLLICLNIAFSDEIEVSAIEFIGSNKDKITQLKGNVEVKRGDDILKSNEAFIYLNNNNKPIKMRAIGDVKFWLTLEGKRNISGSSNELVYLPDKQEYQLLGNAVVVEEDKNSSIKGDKILISYKNGYINVVGDSKKPARLIFKLDKENDK